MGSTELNINLDEYAISMEIAKTVGAMSEPDMDLSHYFADGIYVRKLVIPAGVVIVGKKHKSACVNIMLNGDITIFADGDSERFTGHYIGVAPAGTQKAARTHKETIWLCVHSVDNEDLGDIEKEAIMADDNTDKLLQEIRSYRGKL